MAQQVTPPSDVLGGDNPNGSNSGVSDSKQSVLTDLADRGGGCVNLFFFDLRRSYFSSRFSCAEGPLQPTPNLHLLFFYFDFSLLTVR